MSWMLLLLSCINLVRLLYRWASLLGSCSQRKSLLGSYTRATAFQPSRARVEAKRNGSIVEKAAHRLVSRARTGQLPLLSC